MIRLFFLSVSFVSRLPDLRGVATGMGFGHRSVRFASRFALRFWPAVNLQALERRA